MKVSSALVWKSKARRTSLGVSLRTKPDYSFNNDEGNLGIIRQRPEVIISGTTSHWSQSAPHLASRTSLADAMTVSIDIVLTSYFERGTLG